MPTTAKGTCNGKNSYTKSQVDAVAKAVMKARNRRMRTYACDKCFLYHLTSEHEYDARGGHKPKLQPYKRDKKRFW